MTSEIVGRAVFNLDDEHLECALPVRVLWEKKNPGPMEKRLVAELPAHGSALALIGGKVDTASVFGRRGGQPEIPNYEILDLP